MKIDIKGNGTFDELVASLETTIKTLKSMQFAQEKLTCDDKDIKGFWTDGVCETKLNEHA